MRAIVALLILSLTVTGAVAFSLGSPQEGELGVVPNPVATSAPAGCASPTAPNGQVDFSQCSNAFYVAVILK